MTRLAVIDDDPTVRLILERAFAGSEVALSCADSAAAGWQLIERQHPDVVVLDVQLPDLSGLELFQRIHAHDAALPVVFITSSGESATVIQAMQMGAFDYLQKPLDLPLVRELIARAAATRRLSATRVSLGGDEADVEVDVMIGRSAAMQEVYKTIGRVASQPVTVLIRGESGTGKELVARAIYQYSTRAQRPFLAINCAALPEALLESELFGHEKGAFTGADRRRIGKFEQCHGGTLFLDEVGDMPLPLQAKMLRILQDQRFERLGGSETLSTDVRLIAATNQDLENLIAQQRFRADLFYRLKVVTICLPPLRERRDDLPRLAEWMLARLARQLHRPVARLAPEAVTALAEYHWPGNIRELQGVLQDAVLRCPSPELSADDIAISLRQTSAPATGSGADSDADRDIVQYIRSRLAAGSTNLYEEVVAYTDAHLLREVLAHTSGNQVQATRILGIARNSLRKKLDAIKDQNLTSERSTGI
jgi:nitrogen regulation protein NR(I)